MIKNLLKSAQMTGQCQIDVKMSVISPPQNVQLLANSAPSMTLLPSTTMPDALTCTIFVASAKTIHASLTKSAGGISPTPPPHVSMFYQRIGFLVLDEVDRLLLTKKKHEKRQAPPTTVAITVSGKSGKSVEGGSRSGGMHGCFSELLGSEVTFRVAQLKHCVAGSSHTITLLHAPLTLVFSTRNPRPSWPRTF